MEENPEAAAPSKPKPVNLCGECNINPSKYKCPGCSIRSCSLPCVNSHKQRTGCTGKRSFTKVVPTSQFDDNLLLSDYNLLEDVKRFTDSAQRMRVKLCGYPRFKLPYPLKSLQNAAGSRRTKLMILSNGMSKRQINRTRYNNRDKYISWTIEWRFHSTDVVLLDHGVHENSTMSYVIEKHLKPSPWNHKLRQFCDQALDSLKFFIRKYPTGPKSPFFRLNIRAPIRQQLANITVLEYPVIHVFLPSHKCDFDIINDWNTSKAEIREPVHLDQPSPKGVVFKEEEIEDDESLDPCISDLKNLEKNESKSASKEPAQSPPPAGKTNQTGSVTHGNTLIARSEDNTIGHDIEQLLADIPDLDFDFDFDFDFESSLVDVYDLTAETSSTDFLDFNGVSANQKDLDRNDCPMIDEELEEGEIA
ncbi:putative box C/D snoRNA protein SPCC613.07 [Andrographis paniculata]|uniref:putative box C/D snoRNA protein SPCC613.07 n=1 Tax=Andrographis paniculata TaxID=175694 RepID=UPI0021E777A6|nr:putative box C/D snoRNA protein SPCC613.07 [Andrographis paniculata]